MAGPSALLDAAYNNVSLLADAAWAPWPMGPMGVPLAGPVDPNGPVFGGASSARSIAAFRRANQDLWLRCVKLDRYIRESQCAPSNSSANNGSHCHMSVGSTLMGCCQNSTGWYRCQVVGNDDKSAEKRPRTVRDTIPLSRLACYGGQVSYNEERECLYTSDEVPPAPSPIMLLGHSDSKIKSGAEEPWLMSAVEDIFKRLTFMPERHTRSQSKCEDMATAVSYAGMSRRSSVEPLHDVNQQLRYANRDEIQLAFSQVYHSKSEPQLTAVERYTLSSHEELQLQMRIRAPAVQDLWSKMNASQVRLGQSQASPPQLQLQKQRQLNQVSHHHTNHHNHHNHHRQMASSGGRVTRHRSLSQFPVLQMQSPPLPQLNADVPEFFPKTSSGHPFGLLMGAGNTASSGVGDCAGINTMRQHNTTANAVTLFFPPTNELAYQEELFPYRNDQESAQHQQHKLQAIDHVAGLLVRAPGSGSLSVTPMTRTNNPWFLSNAATGGKSTPPSVIPTVPPPPAPPPPSVPPQPHKSLKATRHTVRNGKMQSIPIPVYQRPPEFYTQQQNDTATNGSGAGNSGTGGSGTVGSSARGSGSAGNGGGGRRRAGGNGVDFSNLILLTRGGKGHSRPCVSASPPVGSVSARTDSMASDSKSDGNRPVSAVEESCVSSSSPLQSAATPPQLNPSGPHRTNQSTDDVFQWLHAAFGSNKNRVNRQQGVVGLPQDPALGFPPGAAENCIFPDDATTAGTRRRLYRDVLTHTTCSASGEETTGSAASRPMSPSATPTRRSGDKFDLLEEEALMQYQSSDDSLVDRMQCQQILRRLDGEMSTATPPPAPAHSQPSIRQSRYKEHCGCKSAAATPPPAPPATSTDESQSPRRRLYRDVLAHRRAGTESNGCAEPTSDSPATGPSESASWSDVLERLEEQALMEYRLSDDAASAAREASQRASEEALTRRYQDLERQALMQYLRGTTNNSEVQVNYEEEASNDGSSRNFQRTSRSRARGGPQQPFLQRMDEEDTVINFKVLQREKSRVSPPKFQAGRSYGLQDNHAHADRRVYRKQLLKKPAVQAQDHLGQIQVQQHLVDGANSNKFMQMVTASPHLPQQMHMFNQNTSDMGQQRVQQQLLQEQLTLLHFNQHHINSQPTFDQLNPFHQMNQQKVSAPKLPQNEFCQLQAQAQAQAQAQQNYAMCQQPHPQTLPQPFSQLHLIELQQRLSHPGLSPQQVVELQTLYQHQSFTSTPELDFLAQQQKVASSKKQYCPQKTIAAKASLQKQTHRRQHSQSKMLQQLEGQELEHLELQQQRMVNQSVPLVLSLPPMVNHQPQLMEIQNRWQQMNSPHSCPPSPAPQCGGPVLEPHGDLALGGGVESPRQLQAPAQLRGQPVDVMPSPQVVYEGVFTSALTSNPTLRVGESFESHNAVLGSTALDTDPAALSAPAVVDANRAAQVSVAFSQDAPPGATNDEPPARFLQGSSRIGTDRKSLTWLKIQKKKPGASCKNKKKKKKKKLRNAKAIRTDDDEGRKIDSTTKRPKKDRAVQNSAMQERAGVSGEGIRPEVGTGRHGLERQGVSCSRMDLSWGSLPQREDRFGEAENGRRNWTPLVWNGRGGVHSAATTAGLEPGSTGPYKWNGITPSTNMFDSLETETGGRYQVSNRNGIREQPTRPVYRTDG